VEHTWQPKSLDEYTKAQDAQRDKLYKSIDDMGEVIAGTLGNLATKQDLRELATKQDLRELVDTNFFRLKNLFTAMLSVRDRLEAEMRDPEMRDPSYSRMPLPPQPPHLPEAPRHYPQQPRQNFEDYTQ
jgi:hypothetical protein